LLTLANIMEVNMEDAIATYLKDPRKMPSK
jgi:hypothetical protein